MHPVKIVSVKKLMQYRQLKKRRGREVEKVLNMK